MLTELQLKADLSETQPVSAVSLPLPNNASTESTLALIKAKTDNIDVALSTRTKPADIQSVQINQPSNECSTTQKTNSSATNLVTDVNTYLAGSTKKLINIEYYIDTSLTPANRCFITEKT